MKSSIDYPGKAVGIMARQASRLLAGCVAALLISSSLCNLARADAAQLDPGFGSSGKVTTRFENKISEIHAVAIYSGSKILVAGMAGGDFALARYNADGSLDSSFGSNGKVTTDFLNGSDEADAIIIQSDNKMVAAGHTAAGRVADFTLARYNADGSLDSSFGNDGKVTTSFGKADIAHAAAFQPDGKIIVAGVADGNFALARYDTNGSLDLSFGTGGKVTTDFGDDDAAEAMVIQSDGKIVVAGKASSDFALTRYNTDGSLDLAFGNGGKVTTDFGGADDIHSIALEPDGNIVAAGETSGDFALARYNTNGSLDLSFGSNGKVTTDFGGDEEAKAVRLLSNGKMVAVGKADDDFAIAQYNADGSLDSSFGSDGKTTTDFGGKDRARASAIQSDGSVVAGGETSAGGMTDFALARYMPASSSSGSPPRILSATVSGKKLFVNGLSFDDGAVILVDRQKQKTANDEQNPTTRLIAKKAGKFIAPGETLLLQVQNSDGTLSNQFSFMRPANN